MAKRRKEGPAAVVPGEEEAAPATGALVDASELLQALQVSRTNACVLLETVVDELQHAAQGMNPPGPYGPILAHYAARTQVVIDLLQDKEPDPLDRTNRLITELQASRAAAEAQKGRPCPARHADGSPCELEDAHQFAHKAGWRRW